MKRKDKDTNDIRAIVDKMAFKSNLKAPNRLWYKIEDKISEQSTPLSFLRPIYAAATVAMLVVIGFGINEKMMQHQVETYIHAIAFTNPAIMANFEPNSFPIMDMIEETVL